MQPTFDQVHDALRQALRAVYERDAHLFTSHVGERSVVGKLAGRMNPIVESWPGRWTVETEYNRMSPDEHDETVYKSLVDVLGEVIRPAYPDLIVHVPGVDGWEGGNLLVVEAKRTPNAVNRLEDHAKLVAWSRQLLYTYAVRLELQPHRPSWAWVGADSHERAPIAADPVW